MSFRQKIGGMLGRKPYVSPEMAAYRRLTARGYRPAGIIDVGAYQGEWTRLARSIFGAVPCLMVEAQPEKALFLDKVCADLPGVSRQSALLSAQAGERITFYEMETGSSFLPEQSNVSRIERELLSTTLDEIASHVRGPLFLKIDVQGAEIQVLEGGGQTLARSDLVQLEVAMLPYNEGAPTMLEVLRYMDERGFVPFDLSGWSRPNGIDLVQVDLLFVQRSSSFRQTFFEF
jgi:FkbM family methyltransferase